MPMVSVRISDEDKKRLAKRGKISDEVRVAVRRYLDTEESDAVFDRLKELQERYRVKTTPEEIVKMIREDRHRDSGR